MNLHVDKCRKAFRYLYNIRPKGSSTPLTHPHQLTRLYIQRKTALLLETQI